MKLTIDHKRIIRRVAIFLVYALIFGGASFPFWYNFTTPSCSDGIKNQDERGIDCGGSCRACISIVDLQVIQATAIPTKEGFVDLFAELKNKNLRHGIEQLRYRFDVINKNGDIIANKEGVAYVLPNSTKFIVDTAIPVNGEAMAARIVFTSKPKWRLVGEDYTKPRLAILSGFDNYNILPQNQPGFSQLRGIVSNRTNFSFDKINIIIVARDNSGIPVAVVKQPLKTFLANENRLYSATWFYRVPVFYKENLQIIAETNIFDPVNIIN